MDYDTYSHLLSDDRLRILITRALPGKIAVIVKIVHVHFTKRDRDINTGYETLRGTIPRYSGK